MWCPRMAPLPPQVRVKDPVYHFGMAHRVFCLCACIADWQMADVASGTAGGFIGRQSITERRKIDRLHQRCLSLGGKGGPLSEIRPCLVIRPCPNSTTCVQTSYKTMVMYCNFYGTQYGSPSDEQRDAW